MTCSHLTKFFRRRIEIRNIMEGGGNEMAFYSKTVYTMYFGNVYRLRIYSIGYFEFFIANLTTCNENFELKSIK